VDQTFLAILIIALGIVVLLSGSRLWLLGAGLGALLGIGLVAFLPGAMPVWSWLIPVGLAILFAIGAGILRAFMGIIAMAIGGLAGGAIVLAVLDLLGLNLGFWNWILAIVGAVVGAVIAPRFERWALIVLAALVGAFLTLDGLQILIPSLQGAVATGLLIVLAGGGILYQSRLTRRRR
jgi:hypothetical protein